MIDVSENSHAAKIVCTFRFTHILLSIDSVIDSVIFVEDNVFLFNYYGNSVIVSHFSPSFVTMS